LSEEKKHFTVKNALISERASDFHPFSSSFEIPRFELHISDEQKRYNVAIGSNINYFYIVTWKDKILILLRSQNHHSFQKFEPILLPRTIMQG
jgi:hypothetical protein